VPNYLHIYAYFSPFRLYSWGFPTEMYLPRPSFEIADNVPSFCLTHFQDFIPHTLVLKNQSKGTGGWFMVQGCTLEAHSG